MILKVIILSNTRINTTSARHCTAFSPNAILTKLLTTPFVVVEELHLPPLLFSIVTKGKWIFAPTCETSLPPLARAITMGWTTVIEVHNLKEKKLQILPPSWSSSPSESLPKSQSDPHNHKVSWDPSWHECTNSTKGEQLGKEAQTQGCSFYRPRNRNIKKWHNDN